MNALASFNADAFVKLQTASETVEDLRPAAHRLPMHPDWTRGLTRLSEMPMPKGATPWRWQQIVADAHAFAKEWHLLAVECGWSIGNVFGFHMYEPLGRLGLVIDIRGGLVTYLDDEGAKVRLGDATRKIRREMPDDSTPLWDVRSIVR